MRIIKGRATKKFLNDYAVAIATTIILVIVLALLILVRYGVLASIKDLSSINPLITSGQNKLVAADDSSEMIKVPKDEPETTGQTSKPSSSNQSTVTTKPSNKGNTPRGNNDGGGSSGNDGSQPPDQPVFAAGIGQVRHFASGGTSLLGTCTVKHQFQADVTAQNAPGTATYRWRQSNGTTGQTQSIAFKAGDTSRTVSYDWSISGTSGDYSVVFELLTPTKGQQTLNFQHTCSLIGL